MTRPEPPLITRMRLAAERSAAVSTPEDWKHSAVGHYTYAEAEEAMAWIAEVRAAALDVAALWCDGQADLYDAYRQRDELAGNQERASEMQKHFMTMADAARKIRALKKTNR